MSLDRASVSFQESAFSQAQSGLGAERIGLIGPNADGQLSTAHLVQADIVTVSRVIGSAFKALGLPLTELGRGCVARPDDISSHTPGGIV